MNTRDKLQEIFREVFDDNSIVISGMTTANDIEEWDSLMHITLVVAVEKEFKIKFSFDELESLQNVGEMIQLIEKKLC